MSIYSDKSKFPLGDAVPALAGMPLAAAVRLAISYSGKSDDDIAAAMGWSKAQSSRFFHNMDYWPSLPNIPRLCEVLGNMVVARWIIDNASILVRKAPPADTLSLMRHLRALLREVGQLMEQAEKALADNDVSGREARRVLRELVSLFRVGADMLASLQARIDLDREGA